MAVDLTPTSEMASEAKQGLEWRDEFGRGGTAVGVARARDISNRKNLSPETVSRMVSFFARHEVDKQAEGFRQGEEGYPSNGRIAWALWGGDAGYAWAKRKSNELDDEEDSSKTHTNMEKQFKKFAAEIKGFREEEREGVKYAYVEGWGSVNGNIDLGYDIVEKGAFTKTLKDKNGRVPFLADHKMELNSTLGVAVLKEEDYGLYGEYEINLDTEQGKQAYALAKQFKEHGLPMGLSIGYGIVKDDYDTRMGKNVRLLKELKLYEVSMTLFPMNEKAVLTDVKSLLASYGENSYISVKAVQSLLDEAGQTTSDKADEAKTEDVELLESILLLDKLHKATSENVRRTDKKG